MIRTLTKGGGPISAILWTIVVIPLPLMAGTLDMDARAAWLWATTATTATKPIDVTAGKPDTKPCKQCPLSCPCGCQQGDPCRCLHSKPTPQPVIRRVVVYPSYQYQTPVYQPAYQPAYVGGFGGGACAGGG